MRGVGVLLVFILGILHFDKEVYVEIVHVLREIFGGGKVGGNVVQRELETHVGMLTVVSEERGVQRGLGDVVVGGELGHRKVGGQIFLLVGDIIPEVLFHDSVGSFGLAIYLWVEGS